MALQWLGVDLRTGEIICELPTLSSSEPFRRTIGQYESVTAAMTIPADPKKIDPEWERAILEGASAVVAVTGPAGAEIVQWGGIVIEAPRTDGNVITLALATAEAYLDGRFTGSYTANTAQNTVCAALVTGFAADSVGVPITVVQLPEPVGFIGNTVRQVAFNDYDDKTVYSNLQDLMGLSGGPEWTMHWNFDHAANTITPVFYVGTRIGTPATVGIGPAVTFEEQDCASWSVGRSYAKGKGANYTTATAPGQGLGRLQTSSVGTGSGRPRWEYRWQPSSTTFTPSILQSYSDQAVMALSNGTQPVTLTVRNGLVSKQFGIDWNIGDDIGFSITGPTVPRGVTGVARCIGYESTDQTITPILAIPGGVTA